MRTIKSDKKAQDEMVGFALIIIIVAVIFLVIISVSLGQPKEKTTDYEANSFIQALLQYTTACEEENLENLTVQKLMSKCMSGNPCYYNEMDPCKILNDTIKEVVKVSWKVGPENVIRGYWFNMSVSENGRTEEMFLSIKEGVVTKNSRAGQQSLPPMRGSWEHANILFEIYS